MRGDFKNYQQNQFMEQIDDEDTQGRIEPTVEERLILEDVWGDPIELKKMR